MNGYEEEYGMICDRLVIELEVDHSDAEAILDAYLMTHKRVDWHKVDKVVAEIVKN
jgi:hypothetical protein